MLNKTKSLRNPVRNLLTKNRKVNLNTSSIKINKNCFDLGKLHTQHIRCFHFTPKINEEFSADNRHRSDAEQRINKVPIIYVDGDVAVCDGGGGAMGHPIEYILLHTVDKGPQICKYCGLRFMRKPH